MQTKFILHGGFALTPNEDNDKFFSEILNRGTSKIINPRIN